MQNPKSDFISRFRPYSATIFEPRVKPPALPGPLAQCGRRDSQSSGSGVDVFDQCDVFLHDATDNVKYHRVQRESSHLSKGEILPKPSAMTESESFRRNLLRLMSEKGLKAAELSRMAGLNPRAVKDIEEQRVTSPKLSTVMALARALQVDPAAMMGLRPMSKLRPELLSFLAQYDESEQEQLLSALAALSHKHA